MNQIFYTQRAYSPNKSGKYSVTNSFTPLQTIKNVQEILISFDDFRNVLPSVVRVFPS